MKVIVDSIPDNMNSCLYHYLNKGIDLCHIRQDACYYKNGFCPYLMTVDQYRKDKYLDEVISKTIHI